MPSSRGKQAGVTGREQLCIIYIVIYIYIFIYIYICIYISQDIALYKFAVLMLTAHAL